MIHVQPLQPATAPDSPPDLWVCPFEVIQDTSEQLPWTFQGIVMGGRQVIVKRVRKKIWTGDYSIPGLEDRLLTVERKSADDLVGSVIAGHKRLEAEHERMAEMVKAGGAACLICEGSYAAIDDQLRGEGRHKAAETLLGTTVSWPHKFQVPWLFAGDCRHAELLAFRFLYRMWRKLVKEASGAEEAGETGTEGDANGR